MTNLLINTTTILIILVIFALLVYKFFKKSDHKNYQVGKKIIWPLDGNRTTEVISNKRLGQLQRHNQDGGILQTSDLIIVLAHEFLDDDILYDVVRDNIKKDISYLYVINKINIERFIKLLTNLHRDINEKHIIEEHIKVIFVRGEILNNFVILGCETGQQCLYSSMIYDARPFSWVLQAKVRETTLIRQIKTLIASLAFAQASPILSENKEMLDDFFDIDDQIMDYSILANRLKNEGQTNPKIAQFPLKQVVGIMKATFSEQQLKLLKEKFQTEKSLEEHLDVSLSNIKHD